MQPGDVIAGRFELELRAGTGGMSEVFRARDRTSGETVAVKILLDRSSGGGGRFAREAAVLSELRHPGIVRYVAHGTTDAGERYLAMEWLAGEDLDRRLDRGPLTDEETFALVTRVSLALAAAHACGVVHRDLKPSNLFLVDGDAARVKVVDFGVAHVDATTSITRTGAVLGTPGYMAPEQVRGEQDIDARADVFSLGCVLFECLTGAPVFTGEHLMAILAKILFQDAPRLSERRPEVPSALDALCARMLAKERDGRPRDGAAVAEALRAWVPAVMLPAGEASSPQGPLPLALTSSERRMLSVVLLGKASPVDSMAPTLDGAESVSMQEELRRAAASCGGRVEFLANGSAVVTISRTPQIATDQAAQAARCALALRALGGQRAMTLATGRGELTGRLAIGDLIDRAARMLARWAERALPEGGHGASIAIDEVTAGLLDARFEVVETETGLELRGEHEVIEGARTLLGKATTCVGRDWELGTLGSLLTECIEESIARVMLITAPAGMGKSRLAHEVLRRAQQSRKDIALWSGRLDSLQAGSAFGLLGQVLRGALGIQCGEPLETRQQKLRARVEQHASIGAPHLVTAFLGELIGAPFPDDASAPLRAARRDAQLMGDQMNQAFLEFLRAETAAHPVLIVLEDLHWGDLPSVRFIDAALGALKSQPWMVLALARPEVHELFPKLWAGHAVQELRLKELTRRASEQLVRQVLGDTVPARTVERIVVQSAGHAFYLEELVRAVAEGEDAALPATVLAMVEARLAGLDPEARRVLRAASVFGEACWQGGITKLLGSRERATQVNEQLTYLLEREVLVRRQESRFPGEPEFTFRHAFLREGAYATLTEDDRVLGHKLAAMWLEERGETDPRVLAEHFERGNEPARAARAYLSAAEQALRGSDPNAAIAHARRSLKIGAPEELWLSLLGLLCETHGWRREWTLTSIYAQELRRIAPPGSAPWALALAVQCIYALAQGESREGFEAANLLLNITPVPEARGTVVFALTAAVMFLDAGGQFAVAESTLRRMATITGGAAERDPIADGWEHGSHGMRSAMAREDPWVGLQRSEASRASFQSLGPVRGIQVAQLAVGMNLWFLGALGPAEEALRGVLMPYEEFSVLASYWPFLLAGVLSDRGMLEEARREASRLVEAGKAQGVPVDEGRGHWALADVLRREGDLLAAEGEARTALSLLSVLPLEHLSVKATLAAVLLAQGRVTEALAAAEEALARAEELGACGFFRGSFVRLVHAEALHAAGRREQAHAAIAAARDRLLVNAAKIGDAAYRRSFLENVPENALTLELARAWLGGAST